MPYEHHPVFHRLTDGQAAFQRHQVLHELEQHAGLRPAHDALHRKVASLVARGVPYFAPGDPHYRDWAGQVAACWAALDAMPATVNGA